jgi:glycine C-acetyltransferase
MFEKMQKHLQNELASLREAGLYKDERIIITPQRAEIKVQSGQQVLNY